jgi:Fic family protein
MFVPESRSWKELFVYESNWIDPQPGYNGTIPGCPMFENHMNALNFALSDGWELTYSTPLDIHRMLTKGIPFFEDRDNSGKYRTVDVWIGHDLCPNPILLPNLMNQWYEVTNKMMNSFIDKCGNQDEARRIAWISHHMFEVIHPFIDGNGRTGRLLLAKVLHDLGYDPLIVKFDDRAEYYEAIQDFRDNNWTGNQFYVENYTV